MGNVENEQVERLMASDDFTSNFALYFMYASLTYVCYARLSMNEHFRVHIYLESLNSQIEKQKAFIHLLVLFSMSKAFLLTVFP